MLTQSNTPTYFMNVEALNTEGLQRRRKAFCNVQVGTRVVDKPELPAATGGFLGSALVTLQHKS
jgi:hypothetical protein